MKGIVFKQLIEMVEAKFGEEFTEKLIDESELKSSGAYTSVGTYDYEEILELVTNLSKKTNIESGVLVSLFGEHLASVFSKLFPNFFEQPDLFTFLGTVDGIIHVEVKKLYPEATLPNILCDKVSENELKLSYSSDRPFADLAEGLIKGAISFFDEKIDISIVPTKESDRTTRDFLLRRVE